MSDEPEVFDTSLTTSFWANDLASNLTFSGSSKTYLVITHDGKIQIGDGLSMEEATQQAAEMLAAHWSLLHAQQAEEIMRLKAELANR